MSTTINRRARWTLVTALIVGLTGALVAPTVAQADEIVRTNADANLRARPGERAPTLAKLQEGQSVRVLGRQGRWLKVSVKGKVGWITRTQVDDDAEPVSARATADKKRKVNAKARKKGWSSMDDEAVGADAVEGDDDEDSAASDEEEETAAEDEEEAAPAKKAKKVAKAKPVKKAPAKKVAKAKKIGKGSEVVTVRSTSVREKASRKSEEKWEADKGAEMKVVAMSEDGDWIKVQDQDGEKGWVASKDLQARGSDEEEEEDSDVGEAIAESDDEDMASDDGDSDGETKSVRKKRKGKKAKMTFAMNANVGVLSKQQNYASGGTGLRANYALANTAPAAIAGVGVMRDMGSFDLGLDAGVMMTLGGDGIAVGAPVAGQPGEQLGWQALEINVHANAKYALSKKYAVTGRAGYHLSSVTVDVSDEAKLPSEKLTGFTVGAIFEAPMVTDKIGLRAGADFLLGGTLEQTAGLRDGSSSAASAFFVNAGATYKVSSKLDAHATYTMSLETFGFAGVNEREATATDATRKDLQHVFGLGAAYRF